MNEGLERVNEKVYRRKRMKGKKGRSFMGGKGSHRYHYVNTGVFSDSGYITKYDNKSYEEEDEEYGNGKPFKESKRNAELISSELKNGLTYSLDKKKRWEIFRKVQEEDLYGGIVINNAYCRKDRCVNRYFNSKGNFRFKGSTFQVDNAERELKKIEEMSSTSEEEYIFPPSKHKKKKYHPPPDAKRRRRRHRCGKKNPKSTKYYTPVCTDGFFRHYMNKWIIPDQKKKIVSGKKKEFREFIKTQPHFYLIEKSDKKAQFQKTDNEGNSHEYTSGKAKKTKKRDIKRDIRHQLNL